ncbi:LysR substrate-binding domain-containing protein [Aurantivibrio infirmus]
MGEDSFNWEDIRFFVALASTASVAAAARQLGVNQSTVFRRLQQLERCSGYRLFIRKRQGYTLTPAGESLYSRVETIGPVMMSVEQEFKLSNSKARTVRIATFAAFADDHFPELLLGLERQFPQLEFELIVDQDPRDLVERHIDIAFRSCKEPPNHLVGKHVTRRAWSYYANANYLEDKPKKIDISATDWCSVYRFFRYPNLQQLISYQYHSQHVPEEYWRAGADKLETIAAMCKTGLGVALLCDGIRTDGLVKLATLPEHTMSDFWLLYHPEQRKDSVIPEVVRVLKENISNKF